MGIPLEESIRLPLLRVIADAGGELQPQQAVVAVETYFSELTEEDKQRLIKSGSEPVFVNLVRWARHDLVKQGHLYREPRGLWRITAGGRTYLEEQWPNWRPRYSTYKRGGSELTSHSGVAEARDSEVAPEIPPMRPHERLKELLRQLGEMLGHYPEAEFHEAPYIYDVVWKAFQQATRPGFVFEVQDKGNLIEALAKLQHAKDAWGSRLFLVVTGERDRKRIELLVAPLLTGTFHRLARELMVLGPEQVENLFESLNHNRDLLRRLLPE